MQSTPEQIGPYRIVGEIGRGGMGVVYLAHDDHLHREVAVKALSRAFAGDPERIGQFRREARSVAQLNHPNIVQIYQMLDIDSCIYLILEYVPGSSLADVLKESGPLGVETSLSICVQVARALEAAHARGISHRDLKPGNIRIRGDGGAKVLDFGLAQGGPAPGLSAGEHVARARGHGGTPGYMAPEQIEQGAVDTRADIFSFGCLMYECLAGACPFSGSSLTAVLDHTLNVEPDWAALPSDLPDSVEDLVRRCLAKSPADRPQRFTEVRGRLEAARAQHPVSTPPTPTSGILRGVPRPRTTFIGRVGTLESLADALSRTQLITLIGPGGSGKTRLATELARCAVHRFSDAVCWVELASIRQPEFLPGLVAGAIGVEDRPNKPTIDAIAERLAERSALIIFDNCEHVLTAAAEFIDQLLRAAPLVHILATSRERLRVQGECLWQVAGLTLPADDVTPAETSRSEAIALFEDRARLIVSEFKVNASNVATVARICRRLDGIPLAIEFAAARVRAMSPEQIERCLEDRFRLLADDTHAAPERFRTLRAAVDWSYDMLSEREQRMLRRLSVFAGGWTLEATCAVCVPGGNPESNADLDEFEVLDLLTSLVDKSLIRIERHRSDPPRYSLLETVREYAAEKLAETDDGPATVGRHLEFFLCYATDAALHFAEPDQARWLERIEADHKNILAALAHPDATADDAAKSCRLCAAMLRFWQFHSHFRTGLHACARILASPALPRDAPDRAAALVTAATMATKLGDLRASDQFAAEALDISRSHADDPIAARALNALGNSAYFRGEFEDAERFHTQSLEIRRGLADRDGIGASLNNLANIAIDRDRLDAARSLYEQALEFNRQSGNRAGQAINLYNLSIIAYRLGQFEQAKRRLRQSLGIRRDMGDRFGTAETLCQLARVATKDDHPEAARALHGEALRTRAELGDRLGICDSLDAIAAFASDLSEHIRVAEILGAASRLREATGAVRSAWEHSDLDTAIASSRTALGEPAFQSLMHEGGGRALDDVLRDTLGWLNADETPTRDLLHAGDRTP